ncbi:MAG: type VI secretion system Vgr family protein [Betaproteobacteria bacterium]
MADANPTQMKLVCAAAPSLLFRSMSGLEEVSRLFELRVVAVSEDPKISADAVLGKPAAVSIEVADGQQRWFHGIVAAFGIDGVDGRRFSYRLVLRPWLWLLTRSADLRIFQEKSVPDIVKQVFGDYASNFVSELKGSYQPRGYCVQYRETDFDFVSRLMEEEGIFYYFRHSKDKHELVLADASGTHVPLPGFDKVSYFEDEQALAERQGISAWHMRHEIQTGKWTLSDYDFQKPATSLRSDTVASSRKHAESGLEVYDYPGGHAAKAGGDARARVRLDEASSRFTRYTGQGNTPGLAAGGSFSLVDHPRGDQNAKYIVLQTRIDAVQAGYEAGVEAETRFLCRFVAQSHADAFRPARITRKPVVAGPQTALVVGPSGEEIHTDEHGRVKVQFHWDRLGKKDAGSSCWLRVAQGWAGDGFGLLALPRIGHEVVVAFLEGDPDQPLVVGSVYNGTNKPPYALPEHKNVTALKSRSTKGGKAADYNELRFDDTKGSEYLMLRAQRDRLDVVENDLHSNVVANATFHVGKDQAQQVDGEYELTVGKNHTAKVAEVWQLEAGKDVVQKVDGSWSAKVAKHVIADAGMTVSLKSGTAFFAKAGTEVGVEAGTNVHLKGAVNVVIEAGVQLTIKAGPASVVLGPDGVSITGPLVKINSGGSAGSGQGAKPDGAVKPKELKKKDRKADPLKGKHR